MPSLIPGYEYDVFISYRANDNRTDWVTQFVDALKQELAATMKEPVSVYFDANLHDGLLETHHVDRSLREKLKCVILIPILSKTYCDPAGYAWKDEFVAFKKGTNADGLGMHVKLKNGNTSSRVLPIRIHDLDGDDYALLESHLDGKLRSIDFMFTAPGVNRPLMPADDQRKDGNHAYYRDQVNKVANAIADIMHAVARSASQTPVTHQQAPTRELRPRRRVALFSLAAVVLLAAAFSVYSFFGLNSTREARAKSIAVLPFRNDSADPNNEYICNGMMEEILNHLLKISDIRVKSRTSVEQYRNTTMDIRSIADELGVNYVVEGSIRKTSDDIRVTVQLIDAATGDHMWGDTYDGSYSKEVLTFQSNTAKQIAVAFDAVIRPDEAKQIGQIPTNAIEAYDLFIRFSYEAHEYWRTLEARHRKAARLYLERAIALDPNFVKAHIGLSAVFISEGKYDSALLQADKILAIDPNNAEAYGNRGEAYYFSGKIDLALESYEKAIELGPNSSSWWYIAAARANRHDKDGMIQSFRLLDKALKLFPMDSTDIYSHVASSYLSVGDFKRAEQYSYRSLKATLNCLKVGGHTMTLLLQSRSDYAISFLDSICSFGACSQPCERLRFIANFVKGDLDEARISLNAWLKTGAAMTADFEQRDTVMIADFYIKTGQRDRGRKMIDGNWKFASETQTEHPTFEGMVNLAAMSAIRGDRTTSLDYLSKAARFESIFKWPDFLLMYPPFELMWDDPRFKDIVQEMKEQKAKQREKVVEMRRNGEITI
jgi:TolB-like protein